MSFPDDSHKMNQQHQHQVEPGKGNQVVLEVHDGLFNSEEGYNKTERAEPLHHEHCDVVVLLHHSSPGGRFFFFALTLYARQCSMEPPQFFEFFVDVVKHLGESRSIGSGG